MSAAARLSVVHNSVEEVSRLLSRLTFATKFIGTGTAQRFLGGLSEDEDDFCFGVGFTFGAVAREGGLA